MFSSGPFVMPNTKLFATFIFRSSVIIVSFNFRDPAAALFVMNTYSIYSLLKCRRPKLRTPSLRDVDVNSQAHQERIGCTLEEREGDFDC